jgi:hypothetical protein
MIPQQVETIKAASRTLVSDQQIPLAVKSIIDRSEVWPDIVYTLAASPRNCSPSSSSRKRIPRKRGMMISSSMMASLGSNITNIFNPKDEISRIWEEGYIGDLAGLEFFESNSLYSHTAGTWQNANSVNGAGQKRHLADHQRDRRRRVQCRQQDRHR